MYAYYIQVQSLCPHISHQMLVCECSYIWSSPNFNAKSNTIIIDSYRQTGNYSETARLLKMERKTIYAVVKQCKIGIVWRMQKNQDPQKNGHYIETNANNNILLGSPYTNEHNSWNAQSSDTNSIENIWFLLKNTFNINYLSNFERNIQNISNNMPVLYIQNLYRSPPLRMLNMIRSKRYITKY